MLIEASRGGHATVANFLLSQPRDSSPIETPSASPTGSMRNLLEGPPTPDQQASVSGGCGVGKVARVRGGRDEGDGEGGVEVRGFSCQRTVLRHGGDGCVGGGDDDVSDLGTSKAKRQKVASENGVMLPSTSHGHPYPQFPAPVRSKPKQQLSPQQQGPNTSPVSAKSPHMASSLQYATDSAMAMRNVQNWSNMTTSSPFTSTHTSPQSSSHERQEIAAAQLPSISSYTHVVPDDVIQGHPVAPEELVARRRYNTPEMTMRPVTEQQQLTPQLCEVEGSPLVKSAQSVFSSGTFSSQIPVPNTKSPSHSNPTTAAVCSGATSVSQSTTSRDVQVTCGPCVTSSSTSLPVAAGRGELVGGAGCREGVGGAGCGEGVGGGRGRTVGGGVEREDVGGACCSQLSNDATVPVPISMPSRRPNSTLVPNMDAARLVPNFDNMADMLQNPSSLENQYLVALAARAQLFSSSLSAEGTARDVDGDGTASSVVTNQEHLPSTSPQTFPNNLETLAAIAAHVSHSADPSTLPKGFPGAFETLASLASQSLTDDKPPPLTGMDVVNLLSTTADFTKLLPTLAALEMQGAMGLETEDSSGLPVPITDPSVIKKLWDEMLYVESNPGYMGALVGDVGVSVRGASGASGGDGISLPTKYLNEISRPPQVAGGKLPKRPYALGKTSFLLDGNFQLDIPRPCELGDGERNQVCRMKLQWWVCE